MSVGIWRISKRGITILRSFAARKLVAAMIVVMRIKIRACIGRSFHVTMGTGK